MVSLSESFPVQYCSNQKAVHPWVRVKIPRRLKHESLIDIKSPDRSRQFGLPRIGSLGKSRHIELLGPLDWWIPSRLRCDNLLRTKSLGRSRQVYLL